MLKNQNILVIGGAGFIGSSLIEHLSDNNTLVSLDNYSSGSVANHINGVTYKRGDSKDISHIFGDQTFDIVFHFGEYSRVERSFFEIENVINNNLCSIFPVIQYVKSINAKLIYSGSSTKFGDDGLNRHASPYAWTKSTNTELIKNYSDWYGLDYAIVYFYNAYGKNEISDGPYSTLIAKYLMMCRNGAVALPVVKPGIQARNFTDVSDLVAALDLIAERGSGDDYGIGSNESFTILEVVEFFKKKVHWLPERKGNRLSAELRTEKTKALGWEPRGSLEKYINNALKKQS